MTWWSRVGDVSAMLAIVLSLPRATRRAVA
jgi:hypothetical protein